MIPKRGEPIRGRRVTLRPLGPDDLPAKARWSVDPELVGLMSGHPEYARTGFDEAMAETRRWWEARVKETTSEQWAILGPDGSLIGSLDLYDLSARPAEPAAGPVVTRRAGLVPEIYESRHRGQGLGTEAMALAIKRAFEELGQSGFEVEVLPDNVRARRAFAKLGFMESGRRTGPDGIEWVVMVLSAASPGHRQGRGR